MSQPMGGREFFGGARARPSAQHIGRIFVSPAAEGATFGATNRRRFHCRQPRAQPMAQPMGGMLILGGLGRNLWRNQKEAVLFATAEGATHRRRNR